MPEQKLSQSSYLIVFLFLVTCLDEDTATAVGTAFLPGGIFGERETT